MEKNKLSSRVKSAVTAAKEAQLIILSFGFLSLGLLFFHYAPQVGEKAFGGLDLSQEWQSCCFDLDKVNPAGIRSALQKCEWKDKSEPKIRIHAHEAKHDWIVLQKKFYTPEYCKGSLNPCSVVMGTVSDPALLFLNGHSIEIAGTLDPPGYSQTYPVKAHLPATLLNTDDENELLLLLKVTNRTVQGVIRGPVAVYAGSRAQAMFELLLGGNLILPLMSGLACIVLAVFAFIAYRRKKRLAAPWALKKYIGYSLLAGLYLISLSRIPREHLPLPIGYGIHFSLRYLSEFFHLGLLFCLIHCQSRLKALRWVYLIVAAPLVISTTLMIFEASSPSLAGLHSGALWLVRKVMVLVQLTPIVGLVILFKSKDIKAYPRFIYGVLFTLLIAMQLSDFLALNGIFEDIYFVRFYPLLLSFFYGSAIAVYEIRKHFAWELKENLTELAHQVAHDVRAPLDVLEQATDKVKEIPDSKRKFMKNAIQDARDIVNVLEYNPKPREMGRRAKLRHRQVQPIRPLLESIVSLKRFQMLREKIGIRLLWGPGYESLAAEIDAPNFKRIISNLVDNAADASKSGESVEVFAFGRDGQIVISVKDRGNGVPAEVIKRLGEKGLSVGKENGKGLGLYHAKKTIESWGGTLEVESEAGAGTEVRLTLLGVDSGFAGVMPLTRRNPSHSFEENRQN